MRILSQTLVLQNWENKQDSNFSWFWAADFTDSMWFSCTDQTAESTSGRGNSRNALEIRSVD